MGIKIKVIFFQIDTQMSQSHWKDVPFPIEFFQNLAVSFIIPISQRREWAQRVLILNCHPSVSLDPASEAPSEAHTCHAVFSS